MDTTITALPAAASLTGIEMIPADQGATTVKLTVADLTAHAVAAVPSYDDTTLDARVTALEAVPEYDLTAEVTSLTDKPLPVLTDKLLLSDGTSLATVTLLAFARAIWSQIKIHDGTIAGNDPTTAECDAALTALGLDKTADRMFFIRDTTGQPKMHEVVWRVSGASYWTVKLTQAS
jgi:hypothetical protein